MDINGETINYNGPIQLQQINYIIPENQLVSQYVKTPTGKVGEIPTYENGPARHIYNQLIAMGYPIGIKLLTEGRTLHADNVERWGHLNAVFLIIPSTDTAPKGVDLTREISIRTPVQGEVKIQITPGQTTAQSIVQQINKTEQVMKLAKVTRGAHDIYIYKDNDIINHLGPQERFYLVPDYETLFAGYSMMAGQ